MPDILRTATPPGDWRSFRFTHAIAGLTMTEALLYMVEDTVGVLLLPIQYGSQGEKLAKTIVEGDEGTLYYHAEKIMVYKLTRTGDSFLPGNKVYWSGVQGAFVTPVYQSGFYWIGTAVRAAAATDTRVMIDLKGDKASLTHPL